MSLKRNAALPRAFQVDFLGNKADIQSLLQKIAAHFKESEEEKKKREAANQVDALKRLQSAKQSGGAGAASAVPSKPPASVAPPKAGVIASTTLATTEEELLALVKQDSKLSSKAGSIAAWIQERDWKSVVDTLKTSSISNSSVVSSLLKNVLGPISEAQGIAKAIVGLAAAIVDM